MSPVMFKEVSSGKVFFDYHYIYGKKCVGGRGGRCAVSLYRLRPVFCFERQDLLRHRLSGWDGRGV